MNLWNKISQLFGDMSITTKLGFGIGLLLSLIVMVAATGYLSIELVRGGQESIRTSREIQQLVLEMDRGMEKARRLHADFYLQYPQIGLAKAHEQYAQPSVRQIAQVITVSHTLKDLIALSKVSEGFHRSHVDLNLYLSSAKRFADTSIQSVELVTELAAPDRGLEAQLADHLAVLQAELGENESIEPLYTRMKSFVQDYRITRKRFLMQSAFNVAFSLRREIDHAPAFDNDQRERVRTLLDRCIAVAEKILDIDVEIKSKFNDFALQAEAAEAVSTTLAKLAEAEVLQARARIIHTHATAIIIMAAITLMGLVVAASIAAILNKSITRRVVRLTASATELRKGNLDVFAWEGGRDELSQLARTFNVMTARIQDLVDNLEQKVEQRTAELGESERRFRELFENSSSGVAVYEAFEDGKDFILRDINKAGERIEGTARHKLVGKKATEVFPGIVEYGLLDVFLRVWQTGQSARHPVSSYSDGRLESWRENSVYKLPTGEIVAVYDDRTAQRRAEIDKRAMEAKLQRAQKMETIGLLAGGVAHDLNNILSGIIGYPDLLLLQIPENSELQGPIKAIRESGQRAAAVVADLLTVARGVASAKIIANLNSLVAEYLNSPEIRKLKSLHDHIEYTTILDARLSNIRCSPVHIKKCIMNLVMNAMEAIDNAGHIILSTFNEKVDEGKAWQNGIQAGEYAVLRVTDDGKGISQQDLERIFEPFYTKKVMGRSGTGLGLAVVWNSVMDHGGAVLVESNGKGTSFDLYFPASTEAIVGEQRNEGIDRLKGNGERILVVDDEPQQLDIAARMLKLLGYDAVCVDSGEKAIDYLRDNRVDLVLLDMLMDPGINGRRTYERIIEIHPDQKAVIASGFSENEDIYQARQLGARGFIKKPYSMEQLGKIIKEEISR
jgi:signal transduction histidine kinase/HAMP domain-containing protein